MKRSNLTMVAVACVLAIVTVLGAVSVKADPPTGDWLSTYSFPDALRKQQMLNQAIAIDQKHNGGFTYGVVQNIGTQKNCYNGSSAVGNSSSVGVNTSSSTQVTTATSQTGGSTQLGTDVSTTNNQSNGGNQSSTANQSC